MVENERKYTTKGLPVVSRQTLELVYALYGNQAEQKKKTWGEYLMEVKERLIKENPNLKKFIEDQTGKYPREMHNPIFEIVVGVYALLEFQAEVNRLVNRTKNK
jgi:hypothetical protein